MAALGGTWGKIVPGTGVQATLLNKWSINIDRTIHDTTAYDADDAAAGTNFRTKIGGMTVKTGSASGYADAATTPVLTAMQTADDPGDASYKLILKGGATTDMGWTCTAIVTSMSIDNPKNGIATFSFDFTVTGALAPTSYA